MTTPLKVAILGEAVIDFKAIGPLNFQGYPGGSPYNVSIAVARLGQPVTFMGQLSSDLLGVPLRSNLQENGVDTRYLLESSAPTTVAFVEERNGQANFQFINGGAADTLYDPQPRPNLPQSIRFVQFGSISLLYEPTATSIIEIVTAHRERALIVLDPNCRPALTPDKATYRQKLEHYIRLAHILKISDQDLAWLEPGVPHVELANQWLTRGPLAVIVTGGEKGATLYRANMEPLHLPAPPVTVIDTVGAGDTFTGSLMVALLEQQCDTLDELSHLSTAKWQSVLQFAIVAAALNCTKAGCNPPSRSELAAFLNH